MYSPSYIGCCSWKCAILSWSYQAAHCTTTSALVVLSCLTDVKCQALSHVGSIHAGHMRWTHRGGRCVVYATTRNVMCMSMACHAKIHLQSLLCWWALHTTMICFWITKYSDCAYSQKPWLKIHAPTAQNERQVFLCINLHWHVQCWSPRKSSTAASQCLCTQLMAITCCNYITYMYTEILHTEWQRRV